jgi:hypothetical protein
LATGAGFFFTGAAFFTAGFSTGLAVLIGFAEATVFACTGALFFAEAAAGLAGVATGFTGLSVGGFFFAGIFFSYLKQDTNCTEQVYHDITNIRPTSCRQAIEKSLPKRQAHWIIEIQGIRPSSVS